MRVRATVPVTAPTSPQWQTWWERLVGRVLDAAGDGDGDAAGDGDGPGDRWRPGATRDLTPAGLTRGRVEATVRADGAGRAVAASYREHADERRRVLVDVDGLERPLTATTTGALDPVGWTGRAAMALAGPDVRLDVTLPWGRLRLRARVVGDRLDSELVLRGRGLWRPLAAVGLRLVRRQVRDELERATARAATEVGRVARDPRRAAGDDCADDRADDRADDLVHGPAGDGAPGATPGDDEAGRALQSALDLSWLRSPVTILGRLRRGPDHRS